MKKKLIYGIIISLILLTSAQAQNYYIPIITTNNITNNITGGNSFDQGLNTTENVTFANVTADYYFGDGSQLTGISAGGGFTTDQNDELNTTGYPNFRRLDLGRSVYPTQCYSPWCTPQQTYLLFRQQDKTRFALTFFGSDDAFAGGSDDSLVSAGIVFDTANPGGMYFYDSFNSYTLSQLGTDTNTNAGTICSAGEYLDGDANCYSSLWRNNDGTATSNQNVAINGSLNVSGLIINKDEENYTLTNNNYRKKIGFSVNTSDGVREVMSVNGYNGNVFIGSKDVAIDTGTNGLLNFGGKVDSSFISALLSFNPEISGNTVVSFWVMPKVNTTGLFQMFRATPQYGYDNDHKAEIIYFQPSVHLPNVNDDFNIYSEDLPRFLISYGANDDSTIDYSQFEIGGSIVLGDFGGATVLPDITETMITLTGGASKLGSLGSIKQTGLKFTGFGSKYGLVAGTDYVTALTADGGNFDFLGTSYVNMTSAQAQNYYSGTGNAGITVNITLSECWQDFENGLLVNHNCSTGI